MVGCRRLTDERYSRVFFFFFLFSHPFFCRHPDTPVPPHSPTHPADPLCWPANGGFACEDEGEESADRRTGHAGNSSRSQRKSLTPRAEVGKTVILFFFAPTPKLTSPPPSPRLGGNSTELWASDPLHAELL